MTGWLCTYRPEMCGTCGTVATLLARTRECGECQLDWYDAEMICFVWYRPRREKGRALLRELERTAVA